MCRNPYPESKISSRCAGPQNTDERNRTKQTMQPVSYTWSSSTGSYYTCIEKTPLVAYSIPNTIQNVVFMHQCFHRRCPQYIFDLVSFRTDTGRLRSATTRAAVTHRPRTNLGRRAFSIAGPSVWNSFPQSLRL